MGRNAAIERVLAAEAAGNLWDRSLLGFPVWGLERLRRYRQELLSDDPEAAAASSQPTGRDRVQAEWTSVRASMKDLRRGTPPSRGRDVWVLGQSSYRRPTPDGQSPSVFASHLRQQLGDRLLFVEINNARRPSLDRDDVCFIDAIQVPILASARAGAAGLARSIPPAMAAAFAPTPPRRLADRALYGRAMRALGRKWMDEAPPAAVFVLCAYNMHIPFQLAAKERGIPVIELQHGVIHESHPGYVLGTLPDGLHPAPDHLVTFGDHFGRVIERECPHWAGRWSVGGHAWLKRAREQHVEARSDGRREVLIFSQYDLPVRRQVLQAAREMRALLGDDWHVAIKPHPREPGCAAFYADAIADGVELVPPGAESYARLGRCELAVSVYSTVAIEALAFPCRSAVLRSPHWSEAIAALVADGLIEVAEDGVGLAALAQSARPEGSRDAVARDLFGVGVPEPDFGALIDQVRARL